MTPWTRGRRERSTLAAASAAYSTGGARHKGPNDRLFPVCRAMTNVACCRIGSGTLDILPHNEDAVVTLLAVCGSTRRESYLNAIPEIGSTQTR
jgi:hypothetical protein